MANTLVVIGQVRVPRVESTYIDADRAGTAPAVDSNRKEGRLGGPDPARPGREGMSRGRASRASLFQGNGSGPGLITATWAGPVC